MGVTSTTTTTTDTIISWKSTKSQSTTRKLLPYILYAILPIAIFRFYFYPSHSRSTFANNFTSISSTFSFYPKEKEIVNEDLHNLDKIQTKEKEVENYDILDSSISLSLSTKGNESVNASLPEGKVIETQPTCDYTDGEWVQDKTEPLYNDTSCKSIKYGQQCISHGRPDTDFLYWKWKPRQCDLGRFDPRSFMRMIQGKHLAFVGDSLARNQLESLVCMLDSVYPSNLVYKGGEDDRFRRWHFWSHNAIVSVYWSPFLVKTLAKTDDGKQNHNKLYFDSIDQRWGSDLDSIDVLVLSTGHWFPHPAVYLDGDTVLGCHNVHDLNCTKIEYSRMFGKAFNTSLKAIVERKGLHVNGIDVIVTTVSSHHFEGDWDKFGACPKTKPYVEGEMVVKEMDAEMRKLQVEEVEKAKTLLNTNQDSLPNVRVAVLDVTKLSMLRPDGHPGAFLYPNPTHDVLKKVWNDCLHWCLPGPIDTWNDIMFDIMKRWHTSKMR